MHPIRIFFVIAASVTLVVGALAERIAAPGANPVLVLFAPADVDLSGKQWADASTGNELDNLVHAIEAAHRTVPAYLQAVRDEYASRSLQTASFAVGCYWEGERELGKLNGVVSSKTGMLGSDEVVQVHFDPRIIDAKTLVATVQPMSCYRGIRPADAPLALDPQQQHDLSMHPEYAYLPLTALQATKVNSALGSGQAPDTLLSPAQLRLRGRLAAAIARAGGTPEWLSDLQPDRSKSGLADYLRSLNAALEAAGE